MSIQTQELVIKNGEVLRRTVYEETITNADACAESISDQVSRAARDVMDPPSPRCGPVGIRIMPTSVIYATVQVTTMKLRTTWDTDSKGILTPNFRGGSELGVLDMDFLCPIPSYLMFALNHDLGIQHVNTWFYGVYQSRFYRYPLGNLYDDCRVCMGSSNIGHYASVQEAVKALVDVFMKAPWNADLLKSTDHHKALFKFKASNEGFKYVGPVDACPHLQVISSPNTQYLTL